MSTPSYVQELSYKVTSMAIGFLVGFFLFLAVNSTFFKGMRLDPVVDTTIVQEAVSLERAPRMDVVESIHTGNTYVSIISIDGVEYIVVRDGGVVRHDRPYKPIEDTSDLGWKITPLRRRRGLDGILHRSSKDRDVIHGVGTYGARVQVPSRQ